VLLVGRGAHANRCRSVWSSAFRFVTVLGFPSDVDGVELLYASLLVQATAAMMVSGDGGRPQPVNYPLVSSSLS
jgi:hypothetical protein